MNLTAVTGAFAHVPTDWIILFVVALLITVDAMRGGASRAIALSLALPITYAASILVPKATLLGSVIKPMSAGVPGAVLVLIILAIVTLLTYRISHDYNPASAVQAIMASAAATALLAVFWIQIPALGALWQFSTQATHIFGASYALFWLVASYLILGAVRH